MEEFVVTHRWDRAGHTELVAEEMRGGIKGYRWREVLNFAFTQGLIGFEAAGPVQVHAIPSAKREGVMIPVFIAEVYAVFKNTDGSIEKYYGVGDCSYENANINVALHAARMAETRAKARALAHALNLDANLAEEFGGDEIAHDSRPSASSNRTPVGGGGGGSRGGGGGGAPRKKIEPADYPEPNDGAFGWMCSVCDEPITDSKNGKYTAGELAALSVQATGQILCYDHRFPKKS